MRRGELALASAVAVAALCCLVWPWVREAAHAIPDPARAGNNWWGADARLIVWILAWDAHALTTAPLGLFDANIFHPAPRMLVGSEHLLGSAALAGPLFLATGNPVLAANVTALGTYVLAAVAMYALLRGQGLGTPAAALGGALFALGPLRVPGELHVLQYPNYLLPPLVLAAAAAGRGRIGWLLGAALLAFFSSYYIAAMAGVLLGLEALLAAVTRGARAGLRVAGPAAVAAALLLAFSRPYFAGGAMAGAAAQQASLALTAQMLQPFVLDPGDATFGVGWGVAALALVGLASPLGRRVPALRWWRWVALAGVGFVLALGPTARVGTAGVPLPFAVIAALIPLRAASRFVILAHVGVVGLAAEGAELLLRAAARARARAAPAVATALLFAVLVLPRALALPGLPLTTLPTGAAVPSVYRELARAPRAPLLEIPAPRLLGSGRNALRQSESMYASIFHWQPLVNGHTGFPPWWWAPTVTKTLGALPDATALQRIVDLTGVRRILVRREHVAQREMARWEVLSTRLRGVHRRSGEGEDLLLEVDLPPRRPWAAALARGAPEPGHTALGTSLAPLAEDAAHGRVRWRRPPRTAVAGGALALGAEVENLGAVDWPALLRPEAPLDGLVVLVPTWHAQDGTAEQTLPPLRLPLDVIPGETVEVKVSLPVPTRAGVYALTLALKQVGGAPFGDSEPARAVIAVGAAGAAQPGAAPQSGPVGTGTRPRQPS